MCELDGMYYPIFIPQAPKAKPREKEFISAALKQADIEPLTYEQARQALLDGHVVSAGFTTWKWRIQNGVLQSVLGEIRSNWKTDNYSFGEDYEPFCIPSADADQAEEQES